MEKTGLTNTLLTTDLLPTEVLVLANKKKYLKKSSLEKMNSQPIKVAFNATKASKQGQFAMLW